MYVLALCHVLGYVQLLVLDESLTVLLVLSWHRWNCTVCNCIERNKWWWWWWWWWSNWYIANSCV